MRYHGRDLRKGRYSSNGGAYLLTTTTHGRKPIFREFQLACCAAREIRSISDSEIVEVIAWVVMPDHIHLLVVLNGDDLAALMRRLKSCSAIGINRLRNVSGPVWQKGYHDHALRADEDLRKAARYLVANPLRAGLVDAIGDYPFWDATWL